MPTILTLNRQQSAKQAHDARKTGRPEEPTKTYPFPNQCQPVNYTFTYPFKRATDKPATNSKLKKEALASFNRRKDALREIIDGR